MDLRTLARGMEIAALSPNLGGNSTLSSRDDGTGIGTTDRVHADLQPRLMRIFPELIERGHQRDCRGKKFRGRRHLSPSQDPAVGCERLQPGLRHQARP